MPQTHTVHVVLLKDAPGPASNRIQVRPDPLVVHTGNTSNSGDPINWVFISTDIKYLQARIEFDSGVNIIHGSHIGEAPLPNGIGTITGKTPQKPGAGADDLKYTVRFIGSGAPDIELDPDVVRIRP